MVKMKSLERLYDEIEKNDLVAIMSLKDELVALGTAKMISKNMMGEKGVAATTDKVFMKEGTYK